MEYLKIKNWDRWQSYRTDRGQPPWIKVHRCVMRNPEWVELTDSERGQLLSIWLLAADNNGRIPSSPKLIQKLCFLTSTVNINKFIDLEFICQPDADVASTRRQDDQPEKRRVDKIREEESRGKKKYLDTVYFTDIEYQKLEEKLGKDKLTIGIEQLDYSISVKGGKYKDHYKTILNWDKRGFLKTNGKGTGKLSTKGERNAKMLGEWINEE